MEETQERGASLHSVRMLLGLAINRVSMLHYQTIVLAYPLPFLVVHTIYIYVCVSDGKSLN